jgi:hypothetical protein
VIFLIFCTGFGVVGPIGLLGVISRSSLNASIWRVHAFTAGGKLSLILLLILLVVSPCCQCMNSPYKAFSGNQETSPRRANGTHNPKTVGYSQTPQQNPIHNLRSAETFLPSKFKIHYNVFCFVSPDN